MKIKRIISQNRRDFIAVFECEHCGFTHTRSGYDDGHFHKRVIPEMECPACEKKADASYRPLATKYEDSEVV